MKSQLYSTPMHQLLFILSRLMMFFFSQSLFLLLHWSSNVVRKTSFFLSFFLSFSLLSFLFPTGEVDLGAAATAAAPWQFVVDLRLFLPLDVVLVAVVVVVVVVVVVTS